MPVGFAFCGLWAAGETEAKRLAALGDDRWKCTEEQLLDALTGSSQPMHREMLALQLERLQLIDTQIDKLNQRKATNLMLKLKRNAPES